MLPGVGKVQGMWGNEPSHSQVNSHCGSWSPKWISKFLERDCRGQNPSVQRILYIIGKRSKLRCLKWAHIAHLDIWNTNYGQKKGWESNWQFDSWPLKVRNQLDFLVCRWCATYCWKDLNEGYNFDLNLIVIRSLHKKLCGPKVTGVPTMGISGLPLGSPKTKCHLDVVLMDRRIEYYNGEGGGFPQVRAMVNLESSSCPWFVLALKVPK
jgi:hypothetical protein